MNLAVLCVLSLAGCSSEQRGTDPRLLDDIFQRGETDFSVANTLLHAAAHDACEGTLRLLLFLNPSLVNTRNGSRSALLHLAAKRGHQHIVRILPRFTRQ